MDSAKKKEMAFRIIAGVILAPLALFAVLYASTDVFFIISLGLIAGLTNEFIKLAPKCAEDKLLRIFIWIGAFVIPIGFYFNSFAIITSTLFFIMAAVFIKKMFSSEPTTNVLNDVASQFLSIMFLPFLFSFVFLVREIDPKWLVCVLLLVWGADTFAYFSGIAFGKHKLIPAVSPAKSVEGLIGGAIGALSIGLTFNYVFIGVHPFLMLILSLEVIAAAVIGDLIESMLKRSASIKDSGQLIPGHGGLLDRFDSLLFAAPTAYFYLEIVLKRFQ